MDFGFKETTADCTGAESHIVFRLAVPNEFYDRFLTTATPLDVYIEIAPRTDDGTPLGLPLLYKFGTFGDPTSERFNSAGDVVPGEDR
jgi:hypothetical protein